MKAGLAISLSQIIPSISHSQEPSSEQLRFDKAKEELVERYFDERPNKIENSETYVRERKSSKSYREITFESSINTKTIGPHKITLQYFIKPELENTKGNPSIMVVPMLNGVTDIESGFARYFSRQGIPSLTVSLPDYKQRLIDEISDVKNPIEIAAYILKFNDIYEQALLDHLQTIDWITQRSELDKERIGATGISFGGILLSTLAGIDNRIKASVPILAGGNMGKILTTTTKEKAIFAARKKAVSRVSGALEETGINPNSLETMLKNGLKWDPLNYANDVNPETTFMVLAANDVVVPTETGYELAEAIFKEPNMEKLKSQGKLKVLNGLGHRSSIIAFPEIKNEIRDFFREKL